MSIAKSAVLMVAAELFAGNDLSAVDGYVGADYKQHSDLSADGHEKPPITVMPGTKVGGPRAGPWKT